MMQEPFRWLFKAYFDDGSIIEQDQDDKSSQDPNKGSTFTDVLAKEGLVSFELINGDESVLLDLTTGNFIVNETPLSIHDQNFDPLLHELRLIYFRETRYVKSDGEERHFVNRYFIGWQTTVDGKNIQHTLAVG